MISSNHHHCELSDCEFFFARTTKDSNRYGNATQR